MSERDDDELQERIESLTLAMEEDRFYGWVASTAAYEAELRSLTKLCECRDRVLHKRLVDYVVRETSDWEWLDRLQSMQ